MVITILSYKGGVGKTTTAIHLASYLATLAPTLLVDGDAIRSASKWSMRGDGKGLPFKVTTTAGLTKSLREHKHVVIDTEGNPSDDDFKELAEGCDLMIVPAVPESVATDGLTFTLAKLHGLDNHKYKVLLTMVPPPPRTEGKQLREMLVSNKIPVFKSEIPRLAAYEKAAAEGKPSRDIKDRQALRAWTAYELVGKEIDLV